MKLRNLLIATLLVAASAATGAAQVSPAKAEWAKGPVQFLMTKEEAATWKTLPSDDAALAFIDLFWARRDPTPGTPRNEFREEFETKVKYADQTFRGGRARGSVSDRGKILVLFGPPSKATQTSSKQQQSAFEDETTTTRAGQPQEPSRVTWLYEGEAAQKPFGLPRVEFTFVDQFNSGDYRLTNARIDVNAAQQKAIAASITQPTLTAAPKFQQPPAAAAQQAPAAAPAPAAAAYALKTPSLEAAVADAKAGKGAKSVQVATVEFVSPTGEAYVPLLLYVPSAAGLTADSADTFFGVVEDASGHRVTAFEETVKLTVTKTDFFVDRTLGLPAGKYTAYVGLAKGGQPVVATSAPIEVSATAKDAPGVSKLVLSDNIYELPIAEPVKAPFAFGKVKVVPKGNLTFKNTDDLWYFVEVNNPGITEVANAAIETTAKVTGPGTAVSVGKPVTVTTTPADGLPRLQYKLDLIGGPDKKTISAPLSDAQALPLSGKPGPGHYVIFNSIPLGEMKPALKPGDYTLKMKIVDTVTKQSYTVEQAFKVTG